MEYTFFSVTRSYEYHKYLPTNAGNPFFQGGLASTEVVISELRGEKTGEKNEKKERAIYVRVRARSWKKAKRGRKQKALFAGRKHVAIASRV